MSMVPIEEKDYSDGRTKQSFKDSTDINRLLIRARKEGTLSHLDKYQGVYGDYSDFDFLQAQNAIARGKQIFEELPAEIRREFSNDPRAFFQFVNDPANAKDLPRVLPGLAEPGTQRRQLNDPPPDPKPGQGAAQAANKSESADKAADPQEKAPEGA